MEEKHFELPHAVLSDSRLAAMDKLVYCFLYCHCREAATGEVLFTNEELAAGVGACWATVPRARSRLADAGLISFSPCAQGRATAYILRNPMDQCEGQANGR